MAPSDSADLNATAYDLHVAEAQSLYRHTRRHMDTMAGWWDSFDRSDWIDLCVSYLTLALQRPWADGLYASHV